jgi:hypothetical protein
MKHFLLKCLVIHRFFGENKDKDFARFLTLVLSSGSLL